MSLETLPGSTLPDDLRQLGYDAINTGDGERILAHAIGQRLMLTSSGAFEEVTEDSTKAVALVRTHAGIARVLRYSLSLA